MKNIIKSGINANILKTIAIIAMVIDHIGVYFMPFMPNFLYGILRNIGRIAMPIFSYLIVQGFFHTKNYKKYITRLGICAIATQVFITILMTINKIYVPEYLNAKYIYTNGNVLFSYIIGLVLIKIIHEDILIKKWDYHKNMSFKIIISILILIATVFIPLDYGIEAVLLVVLLYFIERFRLYILINKNTYNISLFKLIDDKKIKIIYSVLVFLAISIVVIYFKKSLFTILSIIPIMLYNDEHGSYNKFLKYAFYIVFPFQHILLYSLAMIFMFT